MRNNFIIRTFANMRIKNMPNKISEHLENFIDVYILISLTVFEKKKRKLQVTLNKIVFEIFEPYSMFEKWRNQAKFNTLLFFVCIFICDWIVSRLLNKKIKQVSLYCSYRCREL